MRPIINQLSTPHNDVKQPITESLWWPAARSLIIMAVAVGLGLARTQAAIYTFNLHGLVDSGFTETYGGNPYLYELWQDPLPDMIPYNARAGDVLDVTVTLDRSHTIPASVPGTAVTVDVYFYGYSYPNVYGSSSTTASFFSQGAQVFSTADPTSSSSSGGTLAPLVMFYPPNNASITFDQVRFHSVVTDTQGTVLNLSLAELSVTRTIPIPEPDLALLIVPAIFGFALRQARQRKRAAERLMKTGCLRSLAPHFLCCLVLSFWASVPAGAGLSLLTQISPPAAAGSLVWGDADGDDDLDLWISGSRYDTTSFRSSVLRNDRNGVFSASLGELTQLNRGDAAWVDFDRDGDLDALITGYTSSSSPSTVVHRNDLPAGFTTVVSANRVPSLGDSAMAWGDADGDGDLDVLICGTGTSSRQAALYLNIGSGSFSNSLVPLPPVSEGAVAWADFDGDGDQDFVLTGSTNSAASGAISRLYRNLGSGGFEPVAAPLPAVYRSLVSWADYDCDGDPDLLIAGVSASGPVTLLFRNDQGTFTAGPGFPGVADGAAAWGDADQDGYPDLALSGRLSSGAGALLSRFYWNCAGAFTNSGAELPGLDFSAMAWGDLDYDGQLDLAVSGSTNESLTWSGGAYSAVFRNDNTVTGSVPPAPVGLAATVQGSDVLLAWGVPVGTPAGLSYDVRVGTSPGGSQIMSPAANPATGIRRVAQFGQAGWSGHLQLRNLPAGTYYWSAQSVNAAYQGSAFAVENQFTVLNNQPTITAIPNQSMAMNTSMGPLQFTVADAESDPALLTVSVVSSNPNLFPDGAIVLGGAGAVREATFTPATNKSGNATVIFTVRDPQGGFTLASTRITVVSLVDAAAGFPDGQFSILEPADADGDGDLDLLLAGTEFISAGSGRSYVRLFLNAGNATFAPTTPTLPAVFDGAFAAWGDYDGDGDLDLFYAGSIYRQDSGVFNLVSSPAAGIENGQAAWGDYDGDGDLDLAVTGGLGSTVFVTRIYRNDGNGVFTQINVSLLGLWYSSIAWADVDGDGDLDLAVAGAANQNTLISPNARMYRNDGGDQFVEALNFFGATSSKLTWGDVNGDGRPDLAMTGTHGSDTVNELQLNLGQWQFARLSLHPGGSAYADTKLLDWDRDGDLDLLGGVNSIVGVYPNPGTGEFANASSASVSLRCRALRWGDFDNDSDFDVLVSNTGTVSLSGQTRLYLNPIVNTQPAPPATMTQAVTGNSVVLSWPALASIDGAPVTYNLRVGTAPGLGNVLSPHSRSDGRRLLPAPGNAGYANLRTLRQLPPGTYWWTVQAVDHLWRGQPWLAEQSFTISSPLVPRINSLELISGTQARLRFDALEGRVISVETSTNLSAWTERTTVSVGLSGSAEALLSITGDRTFFRLHSSD